MSLAQKRVLPFAGLLIALLALAAAWHWTPLSEWLNGKLIADWLAALDHPLTRVVVAICTFVLISLLMVPLSLLVIAISMAFGPWQGFTYGLTGSLISAMIAFGVGHKLGSNTVKRLSGKRIQGISQRLADEGIFAIAALRLLPVGPYNIINLIAGASHVRFLPFLLGSFLGLVPGVLAFSVFSKSLSEAVLNPQPLTIALLGLVILVMIGGAFLIRRWLRQR
ncbi:MAG: VTT domain-containing protein [Gammaproteobacteria bacterium]|jgi:uncharacterized membrane protein YdjX (TVP38/TMEM64 family)